MFIPLLKVDAAQRLVYGSFDETPDRAKEICDYATAKLAFQSWSEDMHKASGGKSFGNIRGQHNPRIAAGLLKSIDFDDEAKRIDFCAKIVDDQEWRKVEEGVYTGFSPGGSYAKRWADGAYHRYTPKVGELSIVDIPCNPNAGFMLIKADGSEEEKQFLIPKAYEPGNDATKARALDMAKAANPEASEGELKNLQKNYVGIARAELIAEAASTELEKLAEGGEPLDPPADPGEGEKEPALGKAAADDQPSAEGADQGHPDRAAALEAALEKAEKSGKKEGKYGDVEYADEKNKKYPVNTPKRIRAAWSYINMPKNQKGYSDDEVKAIKAKIVSAWKDKIDPDGPPEAAEKMLALGDLAKLAPAIALIERSADAKLPLRKGMYTIQRLAALIDCAADIQSSIKWEEQSEGDSDSGLPEEAANAVAALGTLLIHMVADEVQEIVDGYKISGLDIDFDPEGEAEETLELAAKITDLAKAENIELEKSGRRNSAKDASTLQGIHDAAVSLGADCPDMSAEKCAHLEAENQRLEKSVDSAIPRIEALAALAETVESLKGELAKSAEKIAALEAQPVHTGKGQIFTRSKEQDGADLEKSIPEPGSLAEIEAMPAGPDRRRALERHAAQIRNESRLSR